uniref:Pyridoxal phosphate phosphatase PHOSPHO2 n=1 Tax=Clastoptera arizonana TaxID=38151 RepID=A0A1B6CBM4_9HEMI
MAPPFRYNQMKKLLVALDFDHTIVQENSDLVACKMASKIPPEIKALYTSNGWTKYMGEVFKILHQENVKKHDILSAMHNLTAVSGMDRLLEWLNKPDCEVIIISDSNSIFIEEWLKHKVLSNYVTEVFTNPAYFNDDDLLNIDMYHKQDWCKLSNENLCKGQILEDYISKKKNDNISFEKIAYVGDGENDFCPSLRLGVNDFLFPRIDFRLHKKINEAHKSEVKAAVHPWKDGLDILHTLKTFLNC